LSKKFVKKWEPSADRGGITESLYPSEPLKPKLNRAIRKVEVQAQKLKNVAGELAQRDRRLFAQLVEAYGNHEDDRAKMLASEIAEIRKNRKFMINSGIALEQVLLRLKTVSEVGDVISSLTPAIEVLSDVKSGLAGVMPNAERELEEAGNLLNDIVAEASQTAGLTLGFEATSIDAKKILEEAAAVAEQRMQEKLPPLPSETSSAGWTVTQASGKEKTEKA